MQIKKEMRVHSATIWVPTLELMNRVSEVVKGYLSFQKMVVSTRELGKKIICRVTVALLLKILTMKVKYQMGLPMELEHMKTSPKSIQGNGEMINARGRAKRYLKIEDAAIRDNLL